MQRAAVEGMRNVQCLAKATGASAQQADIFPIPARLHDFNAVCREDGANQDCRAVTRFPAGEIDAPVDAVRTVYVDMRRFAKHDFISRCGAGITVGSRIGAVIRFRFHDDAADAIHEKGCPDQRTGNLIGML